MNEAFDRMSLARVNAVIFNAHNASGAHYRYHEDQYAFTRLKPFALGHDDDEKDLLGKVCEEAGRRNMAVYSHTMLYEIGSPDFWPAGNGKNTIASQLKNFTDCAQIDLFGRRDYRACLNHPDYRQYYFSAVRDQLLHYPIRGINFNWERNDPISHVLIGQYVSTRNYRKPQAPVCFCPYCLEKAKKRGIDIRRAREGWKQLLEFSERSWRQALKSGDSFAMPSRPLSDGQEDTPPADGYLMAFLRILLAYPEILQWNMLWFDSVYDFLGELYGTCKMADSNAELGLHVWHHRALSVFERAGYDYERMRRVCDWIKPKMDPVCGGFRLAQSVKRYHQALAYDVPIEKFYDLWMTLLGFTNEPSFDTLPSEGMSMDYLARDVAWSVAGVHDEIPIYPGIGLDMPTPYCTTEPENVKRELRVIHQAGARGVVLSRSLGEMRLCNLKAAGEAVREIDAGA